MEITDEERTVLEIKFKNNRRLFLNKTSYMATPDPYYATRYAPLDDNFPNRKISQDEDVKWILGIYDAEISFQPFIKACEDYKKRLKRRK